MNFAVVEDSRSQAEVLKALLKSEGHQAEVFAEGKACLEALKTRNFDCFIIDWNLPDMDGSEVLKHVRHTCGWEVPVVFCTARTDEEGIAQLRDLLAPFGYSVEAIAVTGCLHLKSAVTAIDDATIVLNPAWVDASRFGVQRTIEVDPSEPMSANVLAIAGTVLVNASAPRTAARIAAAGPAVVAVDQSELAKAESGLTCCSLLLA